MQRNEIKHGNFRLLVSLCGNYWVAPGAIYIRNKARAERVARTYGRLMGPTSSTTTTQP